ncbi:asparaginase domain-containing protein [Moraxella marmotae]|uniref:asparaginase domain-containing protein n=1 Tax=Moraxella marmotae TaxID=3344520 RepID=UPI0035F4D5A7
MNNICDDLPIALIYAGGTFGSHGVPLSPLAAEQFLPVLSEQLSQHGYQVQILDNAIIKDSSTLTPADFVQFYQLILQSYQSGHRRFVLITGTDSLSFLAAFLANALADFDISLVITGSMQPLLIADNPNYQIDTASDAWANLSESLDLAMANNGIFVQFYHKAMNAKNTQKINSQSHDAFVGLPADFGQSPSQPVLIDTYLDNLPTLIHAAKHTQIQAIYALPNDSDALAYALNAVNDKTKSVILIGFGAGNLPKSDAIIAALEQLAQRQIAVICTTMCAYGGTNANYAAGAWQYQHGVWAAGSLSIAGIYGQALWLAVNHQLDLTHWKIS